MPSVVSGMAAVAFSVDDIHLDAVDVRVRDVDVAIAATSVPILGRDDPFETTSVPVPEGNIEPGTTDVRVTTGVIGS
jgi:hypothetical protein